jgi:hypothetical protein
VQVPSLIENVNSRFLRTSFHFQFHNTTCATSKLKFFAAYKMASSVLRLALLAAAAAEAEAEAFSLSSMTSTRVCRSACLHRSGEHVHAATLSPDAGRFAG